jgi:hypothetical protein
MRNSDRIHKNLDAQLCDRVADGQSMPRAGDANVFQSLIINLSQEIHVDVVTLESLSILGTSPAMLANC